MITVNTPDGSQVTFPDGTSAGEINDVMAKHFGPPQAENSLAGTAKAIGAEAVRGSADVLGLPGDIAAAVSGNPNQYGSAQVTKNIEDKMTGPLYQPQTGLEKTIGGVARFLPGAAFPAPGGLTGRLLTNVVAPGVATEAAKAVTDNPLVIAGAGLTGLAGATKVGNSLQALGKARALPAVPAAADAAEIKQLYNTPAIKQTQIDPEFAAGKPEVPAVPPRYAMDPSAPPGTRKFTFVPGEPAVPAVPGLVDVLNQNIKGNSYSQKNPLIAEISDLVEGLRKPEFGDYHTPLDFENTRRALQSVAKKAARAGDDAAAGLANKVVRSIEEATKIIPDQFIVSGNSAQAALDLAKARATTAVGKRLDKVDTWLENAAINAQKQHSGGNFENLLYQQIAPAIKNPGVHLRGWTPVEVGALKAVLPNFWDNQIRHGAKLLGGGGGLGQLLSYHLTGLPGVATGMGLKALGTKRATQRIEAVKELLRARAPQYAGSYEQYLQLKSAGRNPLDYMPRPAVLAVEAALAATSNPKQ